MSASKQNFFFAGHDSLKSDFESAGFEKYRLGQVLEAVYKRGIFDPDRMLILPRAMRDFLSQKYEFSSAEIAGISESGDDTKKYLFRMRDGMLVESVLIKAPCGDGGERGTLCVSTQVGCASGCRFCASGMMGFVRNLEASEILSQFLPFASEIGNVVVMGMGEPLANYDNLMSALKVINAPGKFAFGARRITVSTCGLADKIERLAEEKFPFRLAISLHGATDSVRGLIMPINKKFPISSLVAAAKKFSAVCGRMITLEYILIKNVNDTFEQARALASIARELHAHVNLIPYNKVEGLGWARSDSARRKAFAEILKSERVSFTMRREKGSDISAACGQLALKSRDAANLRGI